jgi:hypothetical protein
MESLESMEDVPMVLEEANPQTITKDWFLEVLYPQSEACFMHLQVVEFSDKSTLG